MHPSKIPPQLYHPPPKSRFGVDVADPGEPQSWPGTQFLVGTATKRQPAGRGRAGQRANNNKRKPKGNDGQRRLGRGPSGHPLAGESVGGRGDEWPAVVWGVGVG
eukprot:GHVT01008121.1.p1 GENE.GHVT01008121.1~~GHVT01008121.1.p1  ORF type:complete len:105 (+),score=15.83 GHVT01008121.1:257-571(+)